jgi:ligand-binding sensor domain-containing protein
VALSAAALVIIVIGGASIIFGGTEGSVQPAGPSDADIVVPPSSLPSTTEPLSAAPSITTPPTTAVPPSTPLSVVVPDLTVVASDDELESVMSELGLEYEVEILVIPEAEREGDGIVAIQDPEPGTRVAAGDLVTVWLYGDPTVGAYPAPEAGDWTYYRSDDGLAADCVTAVAASPNGAIWVGCSEGLSRFVDGTWETILELDTIALAASTDGSLWAVTFVGNGGATQVQRLANDEWTVFGVQDAYGDEWLALQGGEGTWVAISPDGTIWASGNETGVMRYTDEWALVSRPPWMDEEDASGIPAMGAEEIWAAPDGSLWGVGEGLIRYQDGEWATMLTGVRPTDVAFNADDVWVATASNGAFRFDGDEWTHYTPLNGLPSSDLTSIAVAPHGSIWMGTGNKGIARLVLRSG